MFAHHILIRDLYLEYINNSYNSRIKRCITQFKNGQRMSRLVVRSTEEIQ